MDDVDLGVDIITVQDVARRLGRSRQRVHQILAALQIRPQRLLGHLILSPSQFAAVLAYRPRPLGRPRKAKARKQA